MPAKKPDRPLTDKQERFVCEYLGNGHNATAAYRKAYKAEHWSEAAANVQASRLLKHPKISLRINAVTQAAEQRTEVTAARALSEMAIVALSDIGDVMDFSGPEPKLKPANEIPEYARRAISSVKVKRYTEGHGDTAREVEVTEFRLWDKVSGLDKLGRHFAMFTDKFAPVNPDGQSPYDAGLGDARALVAELRAAVDARRGGLGGPSTNGFANGVHVGD